MPCRRVRRIDGIHNLAPIVIGKVVDSRNPMMLMKLAGEGRDRHLHRAKRAQPEGPGGAADARQPAETSGAAACPSRA